MALFKSIHTIYGLRSLAAAELGRASINLTHVAVGDGNGNAVEPSEGQAQLVRERYRATVNRIYPDPENTTLFYAEVVIPASIGGFTLREFGIFDASGALFVVGNMPSTYKPTAADGAFSDTLLRVQFSAQNASVITLQIDPNVAVASQSWVLINVKASTILPGGTTGQLLRKVSNADGDTEWHDPDGLNVTVDTIEETQTLAAGQTQVDLVATTTRGLALYVDGERLRRDQWSPDPEVITRLVLAAPYPAGSKLIAAQNEPTGNAPAPLERSKNLSDLQSPAVAQANLDVYSRAETDRLCPIGTPSHFPTTSLPVGWLVRNGAAISRVAYDKLFQVIGITFGAGDGFNTFNLPDDRGGFDGNADLGRGLDPSMVMSAWLDSQNKWHTHGASTAGAGRHDHGGSTAAAGAHEHTTPSSAGRGQGAGGADTVQQSGGFQATSRAGDHAHGIPVAENHTHGVTINGDGAAHARPNTRAYMPIIRAY